MTIFLVLCRNTSPFEDHSCISLLTTVEEKRFQLKGSFLFNKKKQISFEDQSGKFLVTDRGETISTDGKFSFQLKVMTTTLRGKFA